VICIEVEIDSGTAGAVAVGLAAAVTVIEFANVALVNAAVVLSNVVIVFAKVTLVTAVDVLAESVTEFVLNVSVVAPLAVAALEMVMDEFVTTCTVALVGIPVPLTNIPTAMPAVLAMLIVDEVFVVVPGSVN
jgi:hypothetical protein